MKAALWESLTTEPALDSDTHTQCKIIHTDLIVSTILFGRNVRGKVKRGSEEETSRKHDSNKSAQRSWI